MAKVERFEDLEVWLAARDVVKAVYQASAAGPFSRDYSLRDQIRRAAVSVMANVVHPVEYVRCL